MQPEFYIYGHPWDLEDEGLEASLGALAGEVGVEAIAVDAASGGADYLRTIPSRSGCRFRAGAAVHFQPDAGCYQGSRIRPLPSAWMKSRNPLERIILVAEKERLKVRVTVDPLRGAALGERHSHACCMDVRGDVSADALCPSHPDVREYAAALVRDLSSNYAISAIELIGLHFAVPPHPATGAGFQLPAGAACLAGWCLCPSCRQGAAAAGVDAEAVAGRVRRVVEDAIHLRCPADLTIEHLLREDRLLAAFQAVRVDAVMALWRGVRSATSLRLVCHSAEPVASALDATKAMSCCDAMAVPLSRPGVAGAVPAGRMDGVVEAYPPQVADGPALVAAVHEAARAGVASIGFRAYGVMPAPCLEWARQAIRYARRVTG